ncbi:MAG: META domain-containing protein [Myxococcales bacterium FL481]|nr:MAG: META domain-containing protein [Myxococcales bacterium FL481]
MHCVNLNMLPRLSSSASRCGAALAAIVATVAACDKPGDSPLLGRQFLSQMVEIGGQPQDLVPNTTLSLSFSEADSYLGGEGRLSAHAGCNTFSAGYTLQGDRLVLHGGAATEIGCPEPLAAQDTWYFALLGAEPTLHLDGNHLVLDQLGPQHTRIEYLDKEVVTPDRPLVGPVWEIDSVIEGDAAWEAPGGTMEFFANGTVDVYSGCNWATSDYTVEDDTLRLSGLALTEIWCGEPSARLEAVLYALFAAGNPVHWEIDDVRLRIDADDHGLRLRAHED